MNEGKTRQEIDLDRFDLIFARFSGFLFLSVFICVPAAAGGFISLSGYSNPKKSRRALHPRVWCWDGNAQPRE
jgi:hypothetical protein